MHGNHISSIRNSNCLAFASTSICFFSLSGQEERSLRHSITFVLFGNWILVKDVHRYPKLEDNHSAEKQLLPPLQLQLQPRDTGLATNKLPLIRVWILQISLILMWWRCLKLIPKHLKLKIIGITMLMISLCFVLNILASASKLE